MVCEQIQQINRSLVGSVNVRLVIVNGPLGSDAHFDLLEITRVRALTVQATRIRSTLAAGGGAAAPKLTWNLRTTIVDIAIPPFSPTPNPSPNVTQASFEAREGLWRDAALQVLVGSTGSAGLLALRAQSLGSADHAVTVWWTRYEAQWVAYAVAAQAKAVLAWTLFDVPGAVRSTIPRAAAATVVAHEICHLFGAPDENAASNCRVLDANGCGFGFLDFPNFNCANAAGASQVPCIMSDPTQTLMCAATRTHLGWP